MNKEHRATKSNNQTSFLPRMDIFGAESIGVGSVTVECIDGPHAISKALNEISMHNMLHNGGSLTFGVVVTDTANAQTRLDPVFFVWSAFTGPGRGVKLIVPDVHTGISGIYRGMQMWIV